MDSFILFWSSCMLVFYIDVVQSSVRVELGNFTKEYDDTVGEFGYSYVGTFQGSMYIANPRNGCERIKSGPLSSGKNIFVLVDDGGCSYYTKIKNVAEAGGYSAAFVRSLVSDELITMKGKNIDMLGLYVGKTAGETLEKYNYTTDAVITLHVTFNINLELYLIPLVIIIGICFLLMALFLVVKYWRTRIIERRSRLTPANLKKIPTRKYKTGDEYDLCAICLEDYRVGEKLRILPCNHAYHCKCVDPWLTNGKKTCPVCKRPVEKDKLRGRDVSVSVTEPTETTPLLNDNLPSTSQQAIAASSAELA